MHVQGVGTARRQGDPSLKGVTPGKPVRDRAIELDLVLLMTALNWAARERTSTGRRLLRENPLTGVRLTTEKNPERPVMSLDVYIRLLEVAPRVHPLLPLRRAMWHSIRRKWATERKGQPVKDVAAAGGWRTEEVLTTSYQQADAETIKNVVLHPTHRIVSR